MSNYSADPGVPQTPTKAVVSAMSSLITVALGSILVALQSNPAGQGDSISTDEWIVIALAVLGSPILTGGATYIARNRRTQ